MNNFSNVFISNPNPSNNNHNTNFYNKFQKKSNMDREKSSPFECGFDPKSYARMPFSLQFFLIAVIFLIFDVEITILMPLIVTLKISNIQDFSSIALFFLIVLLIGLYHEWNQGALKWAC